ncbi:hypothetical protein Tco_1504134 [Tanacetum coccineum]
MCNCISSIAAIRRTQTYSTKLLYAVPPMAEETLFTMSVDTVEERPSGSGPKESPVGINASHSAIENHTPDHTLGNAFEDAIEDPIMQFVVQNFEQIDAMTIEEGLPERAAQHMSEEIAISGKPYKKNRTIIDNSNGLSKQNLVTNSDFYNIPFTFKETEMNVRDLVASPFTSWIRDYDMPDGLNAPTNLKKYDGMLDLDDHLTIFMGTMDVHKLPEPAWCRFFRITLCGAARRFQKTQAEILGIRQHSDESLRDYMGRFGKETLHMTDRSDRMMTM